MRNLLLADAVGIYLHVNVFDEGSATLYYKNQREVGIEPPSQGLVVCGA